MRFLSIHCMEKHLDKEKRKKKKDEFHHPPVPVCYIYDIPVQKVKKKKTFRSMDIRFCGNFFLSEAVSLFQKEEPRLR